MTEPDQSLMRLLARSRSSGYGGPSDTLPPGGDGPTFDGMDRIGPIENRLGHLETEVREQFRWTIGMIVGAALALVGLMLTLHVYTIGRVDQLQAAVTALPDDINRNLLEINRTLSDAITAARANQPAPQPIIIYQPPQAPPQ